MANHSSAEKAIRQTAKRTAIRRSRMSRIKTFIKKVDSAIEAKDKTAAAQALVVAQSEIMRGVAKNLIKKNTGSRKVSRLAQRVKAL